MRRSGLCLGCAWLLLGCAQHEAVGGAADAGNADGPDVLDAGAQPALIDPGRGPANAAPLAPTPQDFVKTELGGYKLGVPIAPGTTDSQLNADRSDASRC